MMPTGSPTALPETAASLRRTLQRPPLRVHRVQGAPNEATSTAPAATAEAWPLHSMDVLAASLVVTSVAAGWMLAVALTGPVLMAGTWLGQAVREVERS